MIIIIWIIQLLLVISLSPLAVGVIRKTKAKLQNRQGAGIFQPYRELWKLFHKDEVLSRDASWVFKIAPLIVFSVTLMVGAGLPLFTSALQNSWTGDVLLMIYTLAIGTFFLALSGLDTGGGFGGFGSSREMTISALAEGGFIFSLLTVALVSGTTNLFAISIPDLINQGQNFLPIILALTGYFIVLLAETARFPFDNPATHLELTMIHEAMILEYSGKRLALMEWAAANRLVIFAALAVNLFFPWGLAVTVSGGAILAGLGIFLAKVLVFCLIIAWLESSMAKFRFFRLPDLLMISFILNVVAISLIR